MKKKIIYLVVVLSFAVLVGLTIIWNSYLGCWFWESSCVAPQATIELQSDVVTGEAPLEVNLVAQVKGLAEGHRLYSCPHSHWIYGDGIESQIDPQCVQPLPKKLEASFNTTYSFKEPGIYKVQFQLTDSVVSPELQIEVR